MSDAALRLVPDPVTTVPKLAVRDLVKTRRSTSGEVVTAVDGVTFDVAPGEFVCLLGPSGSGKTSILNILAGLDEPTSGAALLDGKPIPGPGPDRAVLFQEPALFPWLSVEGNIELALRLVGVPAADRHTRATSLARERRARQRSATSSRTSSRRACANGRSSRGRSRATPTSSSATSPSERSTRRRASCSRTRCSGSGSSARAGPRRSCSSPTTSARRRCWPTGCW